MRLVTAIALTSLLGACSAPQGNQRVVVFAASSTSDALEAVAKHFTQQTGIEVKLVLEGSATLARQIQAGAEADLFLSANDEWADYLEGKVDIAERREYLGNRLVAVVPAASKAQVTVPEDLLGPNIERLAIGDPDSVPAGAYARQALQKLGLWDRLPSKLVPAADVRQALLYVERGEADAGIVYATDAKSSKSVRSAFEFSPGLTDPIRYPLVLLQRGAQNPAANKFYDYLQTPEAKAQFTAQAFTAE
jgi:molybdate transport system substrate-binding protein